MKKIYKDILPRVHFYLEEWNNKAKKIPEPELRKQALASIRTKAFHCEGGAIYGILAQDKIDNCIDFIVAYQTISDYLDNLCDRSTSLDPVDFRSLHQSMFDALTPGESPKNYYRFRQEQDDGGYLSALVETCQRNLGKLKHYNKIAPILHELATYYCDLQVYKHIRHEERVPKLRMWFNTYRELLPNLTWYEFSACAGSTLGIFCLVSYAFNNELNDHHISKIRKGLFPYVQGLHILLDYFIDQKEDLDGGDLNFCFYFPNYTILTKRLHHFIKQADKHIKGLPDEKFHRLINRGLVGVYLSDQKVKSQRVVQNARRKLLKYGGISSFFFYLNGLFYRKVVRRKLGIS